MSLYHDIYSLPDGAVVKMKSTRDCTPGRGVRRAGVAGSIPEPDVLVGVVVEPRGVPSPDGGLDQEYFRGRSSQGKRRCERVAPSSVGPAQSLDAGQMGQDL